MSSALRTRTGGRTPASRSSLLLLVVIVLTTLLSTCSARAQAPEPPALTPPIARGSTDVQYPQGAEGDATVLIELVVEKDGSVSRAVVIEGTEPFAEQARRGALEWHFEPARRGDTPVAARTRARVEFHPRAIEPEPAAPVVSDTVSPPSTSIGESDVIEEVNVRGIRREIGLTTISATDVREMPGAFGDAFRAIEALPGVTPMVSGLPYFFIRGAPPNNNGYFLDGIRVPLLFHIGLGPGVVHPGLLDRVDFYPGAPPAQYGGFAGAIIAGQTREPSNTLHGEFNVRLVDTGALLESPFADGRGTALVAGRYGYPGPIVNAFSDTTLGYWDYQSRATWRLGRRDTIGVFAFGSHDYLAHVDTRSGQTVEDFVSDFHRIDLRWDHALDDGRIRLALTGGYDSQGGGTTDQAPPTALTNDSLAMRLEIEKQLSPSVRLRGGASARVDAYGFQQPPATEADQVIAASSANPPPTNVTGGVNGDIVWRLSPRVEIVPGARFDVYSSTRDVAPGSTTTTNTTIPAVDPRLATRVTLARSVAWLSTAGLSHQYPALRVGTLPAAVVTGSGFPLDQVGSARLQTVAQTSQSIEIGLPEDFALTVTGFLSGWTRLTDLTSDCIQIEPPFREAEPDPSKLPPPPPFTCPNNKPVNGRSFGGEVLLRRPLSKRLSGWISYTLSRTTRESHFVTLDGGDAAATVLSEFDRTHVLNVILAYDLGRHWRAGGRFVTYSGTPYSALSGNVPVPPYNAYRGPAFYRLDVRLEKRWPIGKSGSVAFVVEGQNVTLSKEFSTLGLSCTGEMTAQGGTYNCTPDKIGPITLPSIGVEGAF